ncbi:hypothetical protein D9758_017824 [Tetrapyrgos nigripes]|uniref:DUF7729 domain-containing protein n=1 Tax=Tetrapyrgos nigripes TaxID=182062 RepID=A0A8H5C5G7_9AGAR|nr:hypothetical protein D9758_017824 [Tetrapyrgos nigripes]
MLLSPPTFPIPNGQRTPPPTLPSSPSFHTPSFGSKAFLPEDGPPIPAPATSRRCLWPSLLIPLVLFLIAPYARRIRDPAVMDLVVGSQDSFVNAQTNVTLLNEVLCRTCNPPDAADTCTNGLRDWVDRIMASCGQEWEERNEIVVQTRVVENRAVKPVRDLLGIIRNWLDSPSFSTISSTSQNTTSIVTDADIDPTRPRRYLARCRSQKDVCGCGTGVEGVCGEGFITSGPSTTGSGAVGSHASGARGMCVRGDGEVLGVVLVAVGVVEVQVLA